MTRLGNLGASRTAAYGFTCAVLGLLAALTLFWLWLPSILLGGIGVGLGAAGRREAGGATTGRDIAVAAIVLGLVAMLFTPAANLIYAGGEDWGRKCALEPQHENC